MEKSRPSVRPCFLLLWGMGLHGNSEVSDVCLVWSQALGVLVHVSTSVLWRENGCIFVWMRCQDNCNWSALLKNFVFSVCLCKVYVCVLCVLCVCVHVCMCACWCPVCFSGVLTEALHGISSPPFGNTSHDITAPHNTCAYLH